ncbi:hypothetical protein [Thalassovita gelatinovora]|uniref:hypothetical protein n=1 Tax=Thalassovita gelatinovora TaxID=53501 RepID=UPI001113F70E|nr:hypothetical protein [Thalassovita gelatinovora]QIZ79655.1 hypothetical protein HFZ77_03770 [Thalassovita gelatinovora]
MQILESDFSRKNFSHSPKPHLHTSIGVTQPSYRPRAPPGDRILITLRRIAYLILLVIPMTYGAVIVAFNTLWQQPSPQAALIQVAELELERQGLPVCANPNGYRLGSAVPSQHECRWWRLPYEKRRYCGALNELVKPSQNCMEIAFDAETPSQVMKGFRETFDHPCSALENHRGDLHYRSHFNSLRCDISEEYRHFTVYVISVDRFLDDDTKRLVHEFGDVFGVLKIPRTRIWQFI